MKRGVRRLNRWLAGNGPPPGWPFTDLITIYGSLIVGYHLAKGTLDTRNADDTAALVMAVALGLMVLIAAVYLLLRALNLFRDAVLWVAHRTRR